MTKEINFTEQQLCMIKICKKAGYGWEKFATNVEKQGYCSPKQDDVLCSMSQRIDNALLLKSRNLKKRKWYKNDISDCEAMSFGVYI